MTPRQRILQVMARHGAKLTEPAVADLVMSIDNAVVAEREACARIADEHQHDTDRTQDLTAGVIANQIRNRTR